MPTPRRVPLCLVAVLVMAPLLLASCTTDGGPRGDDAPTPSVSPAAAPSPSATRTPTPAPDRRLVTVLPAAAGRVVEPVLPAAAIDLADAADAPTLTQEPMREAVLAVQLSAWFREPGSGPVVPGRIFLMGPDGDWRRLVVAEHGLTGPENVEQAMALSPDGRSIALGVWEGRAVVVVDLATGAWARHEVPARDPVGLRWSPDSTRLMFWDRRTPSRGRTGWTLAVRSGAVQWWRFDPAHSAFALRSPRVHELTTRRILTHNGWDDATVVRLDHPVGLPAGGVAARRWVAFSQQLESRGSGRPRGVVAVDPDSGRVRGLLTVSRRQAVWLDVVGWLGPHTVLAYDGGPGVLWAWDVTGQSVEPVGRVLTRGTHLSLAVDLLTPPQ